jgi:hypothetical protein
MATERPDASAARRADCGAVGHTGCTDGQSRPLRLVASPVIEDADVVVRTAARTFLFTAWPDDGPDFPPPPVAGLLLVADGSDDLPLVRELKLD